MCLSSAVPKSNKYDNRNNKSDAQCNENKKQNGNISTIAEQQDNIHRNNKHDKNNNTIITSQDAISSLFDFLAEEGKQDGTRKEQQYITRHSFVQMIEQNFDISNGEDYWNNLVQMCRRGSQQQNQEAHHCHFENVNRLSRDDINFLYNETAEYNNNLTSSTSIEETATNLLNALFKLFCQIDIDNNGFITAKELRHELNKNNPSHELSIDMQTAQSLLDAADIDHNHELDFMEFVTAVLCKGDSNTMHHVQNVLQMNGERYNYHCEQPQPCRSGQSSAEDDNSNAKKKEDEDDTIDIVEANLSCTRRQKKRRSSLLKLGGNSNNQILLPPKEVLWENESNNKENENINQDNRDNESIENCNDHGEEKEDNFVMYIPTQAHRELLFACKTCMKLNIDYTTCNVTDFPNLDNVMKFTDEIADRLLNKHGSVILKGLDIDSLHEDDEKQRETIAKIYYYILMTCVGTINETRGRLYDVYDRRRASAISRADSTGSSNSTSQEQQQQHSSLDATKQDNVLFAATSQECGWHTDGSSRDWFPDIVSLLCIRPSSGGGGEFFISNTCNVYHYLEKKLPKFLMYELTRPLARDILEKGSPSAGLGNDVNLIHNDPRSFWTALSRRSDILCERIKFNMFPIFDRPIATATTGSVFEIDDNGESRQQHKFRYINQWLMSGHQKANLQVSPFLQLAIDELNKALDKFGVLNRRLHRGEISIVNNHLIAHKRNAFYEAANANTTTATSTSQPFSQQAQDNNNGRLLVRCWLSMKNTADDDNKKKIKKMSNLRKITTATAKMTPAAIDDDNNEEGIEKRSMSRKLVTTTAVVSKATRIRKTAALKLQQQKMRVLKQATKTLVPVRFPITVRL